MRFADRVKQVRARARIRRWEFRQRNLAKGAWHRLHLALAHARAAYAIDLQEYEELVREGWTTDPRGEGLAPPRALVWIEAERAARLRGRAIPLHLDAQLLSARVLALVPFEA